MKYYKCPECQNHTLCAVDEKTEGLVLDFHALCICEECGAELYAEPHYDNTISFVHLSEEELDEESNNRLMGKAHLNRCRS